MNRLMYLLILLGFIYHSCTDAHIAKRKGFDARHKVEVLSGGQVVRTYISTGKVLSEKDSDGYFFMDSATNKLIEISGDIIISQID